MYVNASGSERPFEELSRKVVTARPHVRDAMTGLGECLGHVRRRTPATETHPRRRVTRCCDFDPGFPAHAEHHVPDHHDVTNHHTRSLAIAALILPANAAFATTNFRFT